MLREVKKVNQGRGELRQRWFTDDYFDLFTWHDAHGIVRFELTYDKGVDEHSLTWERISGFGHHQVDDGEGSPGKHKASPILVTDGRCDCRAVAERFRRESSAIDEAVAAFVLEKLRQYPQVS